MKTQRKPLDKGAMKMNAYINFFPGNTRESRELFFSDHACYCVGTVDELLRGMLEGYSISCTASDARRYLAGFSDVEVESYCEDLAELRDLITSNI